jgi:hypothetical protein
MPARKGLEDRMSRRGNPNWGKPYVPAPCLLTEFEQQVEKLGLRPSEYETSPQLRSWCRMNANRHYVPEYLLKLWGIKVNESLGPVTGALLYWRGLDLTS